MISPFEKGGLFIGGSAAKTRPAALSLNEIKYIRNFVATPNETIHIPVGRAARGRRFNVQYKRQLGPGSAVLCRTAASRAVAACQMSLPIRTATASKSREIFLVIDGDGVTTLMVLEKPCIPESKKDFSTPLSFRGFER